MSKKSDKHLDRLRRRVREGTASRAERMELLKHVITNRESMPKTPKRGKSA